MKIFIVFTILFNVQQMVIYDFSENDALSDWAIVDDTVMGGKSQGKLKINDAGHANFHGTVSLENNGGFSSLRYKFMRRNVSSYSKILIKIKGDGKDYQLRIKEDNDQRHSYIKQFSTTGEWEIISLSLKDFEPRFRGRDLDIPNFSGNNMEEIAILIGNKKNQDFELLIDKIWVE